MAQASDYDKQPCECSRSDVDLLKRIKGKHFGQPMLLKAMDDNKKPVAAEILLLRPYETPPNAHMRFAFDDENFNKLLLGNPRFSLRETSASFCDIKSF